MYHSCTDREEREDETGKQSDGRKCVSGSAGIFHTICNCQCDSGAVWRCGSACNRQILYAGKCRCGFHGNAGYTDHHQHDYGSYARRNHHGGKIYGDEREGGGEEDHWNHTVYFWSSRPGINGSDDHLFAGSLKTVKDAGGVV